MSNFDDLLSAMLFEKLWVAVEPHTNIENWPIHKMTFPTLPKVDLHLVGDSSKTSGRITTEIKQFNPRKRQIITRSGRVFTLVGSASTSENAQYILNLWKKQNRVINDIDVTNDYAEIVHP